MTKCIIQIMFFLFHFEIIRCGETIPEAVFRRFLEPSSFERYIQYVIASFVQGASNIKWCPAPSCSRAIEYPAGGAQDVTCSCGNRFCFGCERVAHRPVPCDLVEKWMAKNASESENANWIMANTKVCPACKVPIEKNQGCNHMVCRMCKHEWCWLCKVCEAPSLPSLCHHLVFTSCFLN